RARRGRQPREAPREGAALRPRRWPGGRDRHQGAPRGPVQRHAGLRELWPDPRRVLRRGGRHQDPHLPFMRRGAGLMATGTAAATTTGTARYEPRCKRRYIDEIRPKLVAETALNRIAVRGVVKIAVDRAVSGRGRVGKH